MIVMCNSSKAPPVSLGCNCVLGNRCGCVPHLGLGKMVVAIDFEKNTSPRKNAAMDHIFTSVAAVKMRSHHPW